MKLQINEFVALLAQLIFHYIIENETAWIARDGNVLFLLLRSPVSCLLAVASGERAERTAWFISIIMPKYSSNYLDAEFRCSTHHHGSNKAAYKGYDPRLSNSRQELSKGMMPSIRLRRTNIRHKQKKWLPGAACWWSGCKFIICQRGCLGSFTLVIAARDCLIPPEQLLRHSPFRTSPVVEPGQGRCY